jgi:hypothetical protein
VPIIVHLVFGQRARRVDLGTLRFLQITLSQNARRKRLKRWLLLALRIGTVCLLAVLFARPFLPSLLRKGNDRLVMTLIDRSGSMGLETTRGRLLDQAIAEERRILDSSGDGMQVERAFFDHVVQPVGSPSPSDIVPRRSAVVAAAVAAVPIVLLLVGLLADWQWRLAIGRALLSDRPYTTLAVEPGDRHIDQRDPWIDHAGLAQGQLADPLTLGAPTNQSRPTPRQTVRFWGRSSDWCVAGGPA